VAKLFFAEIYEPSRQQGWTSDEHFSADDTLIESRASLKSFVRRDGTDAPKVQAARNRDPGNPSIDFRGDRRRNDTHCSTTDPESVLCGKAPGKEARLCFAAHLLTENHNGLCADFTIHDPMAEPETMVELEQIQAHQKPHPGTQVKALGAYKGYHWKDFVLGYQEQAIALHAARNQGVRVPGLDGRTTTRAGYRLSQRIRNRVEEIFGWTKTVGGLRRSRYPGRERKQAWGYFVVGAYNLLQTGRLSMSWAP
jgi:hypothetical protein